MKASRTTAMLAASAVLLTACGERRQPAPFSPKVWAEAPLNTHVRFEMMPDLAKKHRLVGMTKSEVLSLLGPPTPTDKWPDYDLIYVIGPTGIDDMWLLFKLDDRERVIDYVVTSD